MTIELPVAVCACGSTKYRMHLQLEAIMANGVRRWTTKAERANCVEWTIPKEQKTLYLGDPTWITCANCDELLNPDVVNTLWEEWKTAHPEFVEIPFFEHPLYESIGACIVNDAALLRVDFD